MNASEIAALQAALVYVFAPVIILAVPLVLALGIVAALLHILAALIDPGDLRRTAS